MLSTLRVTCPNQSQMQAQSSQGQAKPRKERGEAARGRLSRVNKTDVRCEFSAKRLEHAGGAGHKGGVLPLGWGLRPRRQESWARQQ